MKRLVLVLAIFLVATIAAFAQKFGAKAGLNISYISSDVINESKLKTGVNASLFFYNKILPFVGLRSEFGYTQYGYKSNLLGQEVLTNIDYLQLSPNIYLKPPLLPVYAVGGVYAGYAIGGYNKIDDVSTEIEFGQDKTQRFDFGINAGLGYRLNLAVLKLFAEFRYELGIFDIDGALQDKYIKNRNVALSVGFMF